MADMERLRILLVGNGGREHALAWKLSQSSNVDKIFVVPGNGGTAHGLPNVENISTVKPDDFPGLVAFAVKQDVNLVVPGPEAPLVAGIETHFRKAGIKCFGPSEKAARMEGSKAFAKDFMARCNIPTAEYRTFSTYETARSYVENVPHSIVLKASGLAAGKGVIIPSTKEEAYSALNDIMLKKEFGAAGNEVVIEEYLEGEELSFLTFSDGYTLRSLPPAQDHKPIFDDDKGPNTGGMGCYGPAPIATPDLCEEVHRTILEPTVRGMRRERYPFVGLLFTGIMVTKNGPKVLEYNVRFGDPETQTLLPLLSSDTDLAEVMLACTEQWLASVVIDVDAKFSATVVAAAGGYPGPYARGDEITIDPSPQSMTSSERAIFHAGTNLSGESLNTAGGRVIAATSTAASLEDAISAAYALMSTIHFNNMHYRTDIGRKALQRASNPLKGTSTLNGQALSYADAGVSVSSGNELVDRIKPLVASTARPGASAKIGGFGGDLDLSAAGYNEPPIIVSATDGVGTKLKIAHSVKKHDTIGIDLVAMNVNDLVVQGAEPLTFLDVFSCGKLDVNVAEEVVKGIASGCIEAGCALIGGETAEMPGLFAEDSGLYDVNGTAIGAVARGRQLLPDKGAMKAGDILLGLASSGCHSNGFSLIRKIVQERAGLSYSDTAPWSIGESVGDSLLIPTRIYVKSVLAAVRKDLIKGMAHITGGGLTENVPRMLPKHLSATLDAESWQVPSVLQWMKTTGNMTEAEFAMTFNTGLGMVIVVAEHKASLALEELRSAGETVWQVGRLTERESVGCIIENMQKWA